MKIILIGVHYDFTKKVINGFRLLDKDTKEVKDVGFKEAFYVIEKNILQIEGLEIESGNLKGSNGSIERYPMIRAGKISGKGGVIILREFEGVGYEASDWKGKCKKFKYEDLIELGNKVGVVNGKIVTREDGTTFISAIGGSYEVVQRKVEKPKVEKPKVEKPKVEKPKVAKSETVEEAEVSTVGADLVKSLMPDEVKTEMSEEERQKLKEDFVNSLKNKDVKIISGSGVAVSQLKDEAGEDGMTVEQKMAKVMLKLRNNKPFYYAVLANIKKVESLEIPTMAVSTDTLYFNADFVKSLSVESVLYVMMHEVMHIIMGHHVRRESRDPKVWNIATDLYINKMIEYETGANPNKDGRLDDGTGVEMVKGGLYEGSIVVETETPEMIYAGLEVETETQKLSNKNSSDEKKEESQKDNNTKSDKSEKEDDPFGDKPFGDDPFGDDPFGDDPFGAGDGGEGGEEGEEEGEEGDGKGDGEGEGEGEGEGDGEGGESTGSGKGKGKKPGDSKGGQGDGVAEPGESGESGESDKGNGEGKEGEGQGEGQGEAGPRVEATITITKVKYKGKPVGEFEEAQVDIIEDSNTVKKTDEQKENATRDLLTRAGVLAGQIGGKDAGLGGSPMMERLVKKALAPKINWKSVLRGKLNKLKRTETSYSRPDRRFLGRKMVIPGPKKVELEGITGVKIGIDTSGSIGDEDLGRIYASIAQILKTYDMDGEIIFWDTTVTSREPFKNVKELQKIKPTGGGGTDINCLFKLLEEERRKNPTRAYPPATIIFTDGHFGLVTNEKYKKFKDVIWVIYDNDNFKADFGVIAKIELRK